MGLAVVGGGVVWIHRFGRSDGVSDGFVRERTHDLAQPEAVGFSPQLRDDIHRVLSKANDAFEDCVASD